MIGTCLVTHDRLRLTQRAYTAWRATRRRDDRLVIVDNDSRDGTRDWLLTLPVPSIRNPDNRYPGAACNQGWDYLLERWPGLEYLARLDNDVELHPGWQGAVERAFAVTPELVLLGILNLHEDLGERGLEGIVEPVTAVGGNVVMRAATYREGLRWDERPWAPGQNEDAVMSTRAGRLGMVARLVPTVAENMAFNRAFEFPDYYRETAAVRGYGNWERVT